MCGSTALAIHPRLIDRLAHAHQGPAKLRLQGAGLESFHGEARAEDGPRVEPAGILCLETDRGKSVLGVYPNPQSKPVNSRK
jgi:hypothetical protein